MKKRLLMIFAVVILLLSLAACSKGVTKEETNAQNETSTQNVSTENTSVNIPENTLTSEENTTETNPTYFMDLFYGEQKIWFHINSQNAKDGLSYDTRVNMVYITKNKTVVEMYYTLTNRFENLCDVSPSPFSHSVLTLADFANLSDEEIIQKLDDTYAKASQNYQMDFSRIVADVTIETDNVFQNAALPYKIIYKGTLDASGNEYEEETLKLLDISYHFNIKSNIISAREYLGTRSSFGIHGTIKPTTILDKEYIGLKCNAGEMLVTENSYNSFDGIKFDPPSGGTDW